MVRKEVKDKHLKRTKQEEEKEEARTRTRH